MNSESFKLVPLLILFLFLGVSFIIGVASRTRKGEYYPVSAHAVGRIGIGAAIASNWMSAASFLGIAGIFYLKGYFALAYVIGWTGGYVLLLVLLASQIRRFGKYTAPEFVEARYDSPIARFISAVITIIISLIYCVAQYKGIGLIFAWIFGIDYTGALLLGVGVIFAYLAISGSLGATRNQQLHYAILLLTFLIPLMALSAKLGYGRFLPQIGYGAALSEVNRLSGPGAAAPWASGTPYEWIALCFTLMVGTAGLPHVLSRFYTLPNIRVARWSVVWGIFFIGLLYWSAPAFATFAKLLQLRGEMPVDGATATRIADVIVIKAAEWGGLSPWLVGMLAVGGIMAAFGTITSMLIGGAGAFSYDIYYRILNPEANERQRMKVAKGATLVLAVLVVVAAVNPPGLIAEITAVAFALAGNTLFPVFLLGIWWDRTNKYGAIAGMTLGIVITFVALALGSVFPLLHAWLPPTSSALIGAPLVITVMIVVSLLTPPPSVSIRRHLVEKVHSL